MLSLEYLLLIIGVLLLTSILLAKILDNIGIPTLLLFLGVGMLAGSEGIGNIYFNDPALAQSIGTIALIFILFSGGLETNWSTGKKALLPSLSLATLGVFLTALIVGTLIHFILDVSFLWSFLIGAIISSTDASAVFSILRQRRIGLKGNIKPILELESGSNDPMAIFLTISTLELILMPDKSYLSIIGMFFMQMSIGAATGLIIGKAMVYSINKLKFAYEGIYPVFAIAVCITLYSFTALIGGSGFLALYIGGIVIGNSQFIHKKSSIRFFDGLAVLGQLAMFLTLGLLIYPSRLIEVMGIGLIVGAALMFVARPISVFIALIPFKYNWKEKLFVSWVGLRAAVPIILATFPLLAGIEKADMIFDVVFFIVVLSTVLQGWTINPVAKLLKLSQEEKKKPELPIEFNATTSLDTDLLEFIIPYNSNMKGRQIVELDFPHDSRIILIWRDETSIIPIGETVLETGDTVLVLVNKKNIEQIKNIFSH
ncbi:MAG: potassium/proton antiporter [Melioribacteraceae bacterium]|nr:potassium/proton antiporter [Melioribacteraceae bacterium]